MGLNIGFRSCSSYDKKRSTFDSTAITNAINNPNPDPNHYKVLSAFEVGPMLIVEIVYPDCANYEGRKILVYEKITYSELLRQKSIDPHFSDSKEFKSPIARFSPTLNGMKMAKFFCEEWVNQGVKQ